MVDFQFSGLNIPDPDGPEHSDAAKETILESEQPDVSKQTMPESDVDVSRGILCRRKSRMRQNRLLLSLM